MIHSRSEELKNTQVKYEFPTRVGDAVPVLLTAPASAPTTSPQLALSFYWDKFSH